MSLYALIDQTNTVTAVAVWDGVTTFNTHGLTAVQVPQGTACAPGYTFTAPSTFTFGQTTAQLQAQNSATLNGQVAGALTRLRQIQTQATTFASQGTYSTANLANLNDLLAKSQTIATAVGDLASDLVALARIISNQFDATN